MAVDLADRAKRYQALTLPAGVLLAFAAFVAIVRFEDNERRHDFLELASDHALLVRTTFARAAETGLAAALVKTRSSNENLLNTILSIIPAARA